jgi:hypothetical protein
MALTQADLIARCEATSDHSVAVYDRPRTEVTDPHGQHIGTVNAGPNGVEAFRTHYSLAERSSARLQGPFKTVGEGVAALIADHESGKGT